jgi:hypothetical protein
VDGRKNFSAVLEEEAEPSSKGCFDGDARLLLACSKTEVLEQAAVFNSIHNLLIL